MQPPRTAYPATETALRATLGDAPLDRASFERRLAPCTLPHCRGTCCSEGVRLNGEEATVLRHLVCGEAEHLRSLGVEDPEGAIVREGRGWRTALRPEPFHGRVPDYPAHLGDTACTLLLEDSRCALQVLAEARGLHPWHYKPLACWLHPISLSAEGIRLHDETSDPYREDGYAGFTSQTHCGRTDPCGQPAREVLRTELEFLGEILGRDLPGETRGEAVPDGGGGT
ncbi:MAG TPA: hypothetical protein VHG28_24795 [Longimicrobiaceae bacterium]|nr:hypothetical protein [Longimicrobiaceae bacterium]